MSTPFHLGMFELSIFRPTAAAVALAVTMLVAACSDGPPPIDCAQAGNAFHFMQTAASAEIEEVGGELRLTLRDVGRTTWHTDRPDRDAGLLDTGAFVSLWDDFGIDEGAPAAVTMADGTLLTSSIVGLFDPVWNEDERTLRYRIDEMADGFGVGALEEGTFDDVVVLVDPTAIAENCAPDRRPELLFVQSGMSGSVSDTEDGLELRLEGVSATQFYSSEPDRAAGVVDTRTFLDDWASSPDAAEDRPQAVLDVPGRNDGPRQVLVELARPRVEGDTVSFLVNVVSNAATLDATDLPSAFDEAALFIDAFRTPTNARISRGVSRAFPSGTSPSVSVGNLYMIVSQAVSQAAYNATVDQQQGNVTNQASTDAGIIEMLNADAFAEGIATWRIFE